MERRESQLCLLSVLFSLSSSLFSEFQSCQHCIAFKAGRWTAVLVFRAAALASAKNNVESSA